MKKIFDIRILVLLFIGAICALSVAPFVILFVGSFFPGAISSDGIDRLWPVHFQWDNYTDLFSRENEAAKSFQKYFINTLTVGGAAAFIVTIISVLSAYVFTRFKFKNEKIFYYLIILGYLFSPIMIVFPYSVLLKSIGLLNDIKGLILANIAFCLPFGMWLSINYMRAVPADYDRMASADGLRWWQVLGTVIIRRMMPGMWAVAMFTFILSWNDVLLAERLASADSYTLGFGLKELITNMESSDYGVVAAGSLIVTSLAVLVFGTIQATVDRQLLKESKEL